MLQIARLTCFECLSGFVPHSGANAGAAGIIHTHMLPSMHYTMSCSVIHRCTRRWCSGACGPASRRSAPSSLPPAMRETWRLSRSCAFNALSLSVGAGIYVAMLVKQLNVCRYLAALMDAESDAPELSLHVICCQAWNWLESSGLEANSTCMNAVVGALARGNAWRGPRGLAGEPACNSHLCGPHSANIKIKAVNTRCKVALLRQHLQLVAQTS